MEVTGVEGNGEGVKVNSQCPAWTEVAGRWRRCQDGEPGGHQGSLGVPVRWQLHTGRRHCLLWGSWSQTGQGPQELERPERSREPRGQR